MGTFSIDHWYLKWMIQWFSVSLKMSLEVIVSLQKERETSWQTLREGDHCFIDRQYHQLCSESCLRVFSLLVLHGEL